MSVSPQVALGKGEAVVVHQEMEVAGSEEDAHNLENTPASRSSFVEI